MKNKTARLSVVPALFLIIAAPIAADASGFSDCHAVAKKVFTYPSDAIEACSKTGPGFQACYEIAKKVFTYPSEMIKACEEAGAGFSDCYAVAKDVFTFPSDAIQACKSVK